MIYVVYFKVFSVALEQLRMYFLSSFVLTGDRYVRLALVAALTQTFLLLSYPNPSADSGLGIRSVRRSNHWPSVNRKLTLACHSLNRSFSGLSLRKLIIRLSLPPPILSVTQNQDMAG